MRHSSFNSIFAASACCAAALLAGCGGAPAAADARAVAAASAIPGPAPDAQCPQVDPPAHRTSPSPALVIPDTAAVITILDAGTVETLPTVPGSQMPTLQTTLLFAIVRSGNLDASVEVAYSTRSGSATEYADFEPAYDRTITFAPQETVKHVAIDVRNDADPECTEDFVVRLASTQPDVVIAAVEASGTILDDDTDAQSRPDTTIENPVTASVAAPSDYCESMANPQPGTVSACSAVSCATGQPMYWTHCPGGQAVSDLLEALE